VLIFFSAPLYFTTLWALWRYRNCIIIILDILLNVMNKSETHAACSLASLQRKTQHKNVDITVTLATYTKVIQFIIQ